MSPRGYATLCSEETSGERGKEQRGKESSKKVCDIISDPKWSGSAEEREREGEKASQTTLN